MQIVSFEQWKESSFLKLQEDNELVDCHSCDSKLVKAYGYDAFCERCDGGGTVEARYIELDEYQPNKDLYKEDVINEVRKWSSYTGTHFFENLVKTKEIFTI